MPQYIIKFPGTTGNWTDDEAEAREIIYDTLENGEAMVAILYKLDETGNYERIATFTTF